MNGSRTRRCAPAVAVGQMVATRVPAQKRQPFAVAFDHIAELFSDKRLASEVVLLVDELFILVKFLPARKADDYSFKNPLFV